MRLVDAETYARYTGDTSTDAEDVDEALDDATQLLEERLGRTLALGTHTETLRRIGGRVYPSVLPLSSATGYEVEGDAIVDVQPDTWTDRPDGPATVTYVGGFTTETLPRAIARDISFCAQQLLEVQVASEVPVGATSVRVGDIAVGFGGDGAGRARRSYSWSADTLRWRRRGL